jgi:hypothetical protein
VASAGCPLLLLLCVLCVLGVLGWWLLLAVQAA